MGVAGTRRRANARGGAALLAHHARHKAAEVTFSLNPKQLAFVFSPARFGFYVGGVGAGKTYAGALRAVIRSQEHPGSVGLVGAPTYPMLRDVTQRTFFELCPPRLIRGHSKTDGHTWMRNGSEILWRSTDNADRLRGLNLAWFWLDEAPLCGYYAWQMLKARLRQSGMETAGWATGTPHGRDGYARDFELEPAPHHALYRASTRENAHNLPAGFIADLGYTGQFAEQEIEGRFVSFDGLVYTLDASQPDGHVRAHDGRPFVRVVGGIDWGYTNPTAAVVLGLDGDRRAWLVEEWYKRRAPDEERMPAIVDLSRRWGVSTWHADAEDPGAIDTLNAALARAGLQCRAVAAKKGAGSVRAGIQTVTAAMSLRGDGTRGLYVDSSCVNTLAEFGAYAYATADRARRDPSEEPIAQANHAMDAVRYALHGELAGMARTEAYLADLARMAEAARHPQAGDEEVWY